MMFELGWVKSIGSAAGVYCEHFLDGKIQLLHTCSNGMIRYEV